LIFYIIRHEIIWLSVVGLVSLGKPDYNSRN